MPSDGEATGPMRAGRQGKRPCTVTSSRAMNAVSSSGAWMQDAVGNRATDLSVAPLRMPLPGTSRHQLPHVVVHAQSLLHTLCRSHRPEVRLLSLVSGSLAFENGGGTHAEKLG